jgi:hypothetical protein
VSEGNASLAELLNHPLGLIVLPLQQKSSPFECQSDLGVHYKNKYTRGNTALPDLLNHPLGLLLVLHDYHIKHIHMYYICEYIYMYVCIYIHMHICIHT